MDPMAVAAAAVSQSQAQVQMAMAAKFAKMNAASESSVAALVESASQNLQQLAASLGSGVGASLDISA
jgi:hypothetical protein